MSKPEISAQIRIQSDPHYWYTVEDHYIDVGCDGLTISYWEAIYEKGTLEDKKRHTHMCIETDSALAIADAIYKLFKKENC